MNVWSWNSLNGRLEDPSEDVSSWTLQAADSWFVENGRVRAFDRHRARFGGAAAQVGVAEQVTDDFWTAVVEKIPEAGEWFPRVDVVESAQNAARALALRLRPAPTRTRELRVLIPPYSDPRRSPGRKGPDIALLEDLRKHARTEYDCDEVLLLNEDGYVIEGATTSLFWWDGNTLNAPDSELGVLPGVTSTIILDEARARSIPVEHRRALPEDFVGREAWLVNALHGIRRVREFVDARTESTREYDQSRSHDRFGRWRDWIENMRRPAVEPRRIDDTHLSRTVITTSRRLPKR